MSESLVADCLRNARKCHSLSRGAASAEWRHAQLLEAHYWLGLAGLAATLPTASGTGLPLDLAREEIEKALADGP